MKRLLLPKQETPGPIILSAAPTFFDPFSSLFSFLEGLADRIFLRRKGYVVMPPLGLKPLGGRGQVT
jgi:hypothetical protein